MSTRTNQRFQFAFTAAFSLHALAALWMIEYSRSVDASGALVANVLNMNWEVENTNTPVPRVATKKISSNGPAKMVAAEPAQSSGAPNPEVMQNYLASIRERLGNAIHLHEPRGTVSSQLILKVAINSSGTVSQTQIEKTSQHPEIDQAVLTAFESLLPLAPFPSGSNQSETITVRIPVVIRPKN
jgi:TonB family protein